MVSTLLVVGLVGGRVVGVGGNASGRDVACGDHRLGSAGCQGDVVFDGPRLVGRGVLVDDKAHAALAMPSLGAVQPDGAGVVDLEVPPQHHALGRCLCGGEEARVEAHDRCVDHGDGDAGVVEGRLGHGVVAAHKLELDRVADGGGDAVGREEVARGAIAGSADHDGDEVVGLCHFWCVSNCLSLPPFSNTPSMFRWLLTGGGAEEGGGGDSSELHFEIEYFFLWVYEGEKRMEFGSSSKSVQKIVVKKRLALGRTSLSKINDR